jgi:hypothetical protein
MLKLSKKKTGALFQSSLGFSCLPFQRQKNHNQVGSLNRLGGELGWKLPLPIGPKLLEKSHTASKVKDYWGEEWWGGVRKGEEVWRGVRKARWVWSGKEWGVVREEKRVSVCLLEPAGSNSFWVDEKMRYSKSSPFDLSPGYFYD